MFADVYSDEVNQVNVRRLGVTRTLVFTPVTRETLDAVDPAN
jgi:hypothetical protein